MPRFRFLSSIALGLLVASVAAAQDKRPMTIVELIDVPSVGSPAPVS